MDSTSNAASDLRAIQDLIKQNPHQDWENVQESRPDYNPTVQWSATKTPNPGWKIGDGANNDEWKKKNMLHVDPKARDHLLNYKLMVSSTAPRPIALVSTVSKDGKTSNLAPFSYFQNVSTDPPLYMLSFVGKEKDTLQNILDTGELCISIISDWFVEAALHTSISAPPTSSEWALSGLHASPSTLVAAPYVSESAFSIEARLHSTQEILSPSTGLRSAFMVFVEAVQFHVREDAVNDVNEPSAVDISVLRPIWSAGSITYGTIREGFERPRPDEP